MATNRRKSVVDYKEFFFGKSVSRWIIWTFFILGCTIGSLYTFIDRVLYLASEPSSTRIIIERSQSIDFPAVTVCNLNSLRASFLKQEGIFEVMQEILRYNSSSAFDSCNRQLETVSDPPNVTLENLYVRGAYTREDFIVDCGIFGDTCGDDFERMETSIGNCYTFNSGRRRPVVQASGPGSRLALHLFVNIQQEEYVSSTYLDAGVRVIIHPQSEPPLPIDRGITVPPGRNALIGIKKYVSRDTTGQSCRTTTDSSDFNYLQPEYNYSMPACSLDCLFTEVASNCNCSYLPRSFSPDTPRVTDLPTCGFKDICCVQFMMYPEHCNCLPACEKVSYDTLTTYSSLPALNATTAQDIAGVNYLGIIVYFESLNTVVSVTSADYTVVSLIADTGGLLGLFLGFSVVSILDFGMWLYDKIMLLRDIRQKRLKFQKHRESSHQLENGKVCENIKEIKGSYSNEVIIEINNL